MKPSKTGDQKTSRHKVLLYADHGWGKTTQAKHMKARYGKGLILSAEGGLLSLRNQNIDYFSIRQWDKFSDENETNGYSIDSFIEHVSTPEFKAEGYQWLMLDSLTEISDMAMVSSEAEAKLPRNLTDKGNVNNFLIWDFYNSKIVGLCKFIRDLDMHVVVTALAKQDTDDNGTSTFWPMLKGRNAQRQVSGIFDHVFCGVRRFVAPPESPKPLVKRYLVTDQYNGWYGKCRDELKRLRPVEAMPPDGDITLFLNMIDMPEEEYKTTRENLTEINNNTGEKQ